jgi:NADPH:quinone reductase-like Zn-dependent oxidoreductase
LPLPSGLGSEAAGVVAALGEGVTDFTVGQRVGYCSGVIGSYAQANNVPVEKLVRLPGNISDDVAAAILLKGMTAQYLLRRIHPVKAGEDHRLSCRGRRRGPDRLPMGQTSWRHGDRLNHFAGKSGIGPRQWLRPCAQHP